METKVANKNFIIIDDDPINNHICSLYIQIVFPGATITTFTSPQEGIDHIHTTYSESIINDTVLFLDINMPILNGWDVLDRIMLLPEKIKAQFTIYILSSSVSIDDKLKANSISLISGFLEKPLSIESLHDLKQ